MPERPKCASSWPDLSTPRTDHQDMRIPYRGNVSLSDTLELLFSRVTALEAKVEKQTE